MPAQRKSPPIAAPITPPPVSSGFSIPPAGSTSNQSISESPILTTPTSTKSMGATLQKPIFARLPIMVVAIVMGGIGVAIIGGLGYLYFQSSSEKTSPTQTTARPTTPAQPASTALLSITPLSGELTGETQQTLNFSLDLTSPPVTLSELSFSALFSGEVPTDLVFTAESLPGFIPAVSNIVDIDEGKKLSVTFTAAAGQAFTPSTVKIPVGSVTFTSPTRGEMSVRFDTSDSKAVLRDTGVDILQPSNIVAYTFESPVVTTAAETNAVAPQTSGSGNTIALASISPTKTATPTVRGGVDGAAMTPTPTKTPTKTPTRTPAPTTGALLSSNITTTLTKTPTSTKTPTRTPTPTTTRQSSQPAETQEKPVSGSVSDTFALIGGGAFCILIGLGLHFTTLHKKHSRTTHS